MIKSGSSDGVTIYSFESGSKLTGANSDTIKETLAKHFAKPADKIIIDLGNISFIDSSGFAILLSTLRRSKVNSGKFRICNIPPRTMNTFKLLRLDKVFEIYNSKEECIKSFT
jgi:anti-sigma B factor antagonist